MTDTPLSTSSALHERQAPSDAVVSAVADAKGVSPLDLRPLATVIDSDALDRLVDSMVSRADEPTNVVEFPYSGYVVTVAGNGRVDVAERDG